MSEEEQVAIDVPSGQPPTLHSFAPSEEQDRMTGNMLLHHESFGDEPESIQCTFSDTLETSGQDAYRRNKYKVTEDWVPLDTGFLKAPGMIVVDNVGTRHRANPTDEQRQEDRVKVIEIRTGDDEPWIVRPGRFFVGECRDAAAVQIRCVKGSTVVRLVAYPK